MKSVRSILLASLATASVAVISTGCGTYSSGGEGGSSAGGTTSGSGGSTSGSGGTTSGAGGTTSGAGGTTSTSGGSGGDNDPTPSGTLPADILNNAGRKVVTAHSTVRVIVSGYTGPLYQLCNGSASPGPNSCQGETKDIKATSDGYANKDDHDAFCPAGSSCTFTKIYDQSGQGNDLEPAPAGGAKKTPDNPAKGLALPVTVNGHGAYGILIKPGMGYRTGCNGCTLKKTKGMALNDEPQSMYMITSGKDTVDGCCFDYGNAETTSNDDGNGTMEAIYFGGGVVWGTGYGGKPGPWVMGDLENGVFAGWENGQDKNISTNMPMKTDFVTAIVLGDTREKNGGKGRFVLYGGDATNGSVALQYDGIRPERPGYVPMQKQGSLILGTGGDNSSGGGGRFYEGCTATGPVVGKTTVDAIQAAIVAAGYGK